MSTPEPGTKAEFSLSDMVCVAQELLEDILLNIRGLKAFSPETENLRNILITELTMDIGRYVEVTTLLSKVILAKNKDAIASVKKSHIHLLFIMKAINQAQQKQDLVALEELIKYELKDNLTQWKIDLIPLTKRYLQNSPSI